MEGGATSPTGMFLLITGFICDLISFIPIIGPIISVIIIGGLLFIFKDQLGSKKEEVNTEEEKQGEGEKKSEGVETKESKKYNEEFTANLEKKTKEGAASERQQDLLERRKADKEPKKELPKNQPAGAKNTKGSVVKDLAKGDIKGIGKKLLRNFLINLIPFVGPILASYTMLIWKML